MQEADVKETNNIPSFLGSAWSILEKWVCGGHWLIAETSPWSQLSRWELRIPSCTAKQNAMGPRGTAEHSGEGALDAAGCSGEVFPSSLGAVHSAAV